MSDSYKKYLDKAKKNKDSKTDHDKSNLKALKDSFIKFLKEEAKEPKKYAFGAPNIAAGRVKMAVAPQALAMPKAMAEPKLHFAKPMHMKRFDEGTAQVQPSQQEEYQAKDYPGKGDGDSSGPLSRMADGGPVYSKGQFKGEDFSDNGLRKFLATSSIKPNIDRSYDEGTSNVKIDPSLAEMFRNWAGPKPAPTPEKESLEDKYARIKQENSERMSGKRSTEVDPATYSNGTSDVPEQTPEEAGIEAVAKRKAVLKAAGIDPEQSDDEIEIEAEEKKRRSQQPRNYDEGTSNAQPSTPIDPDKAKDVQDSMRKAFGFNDGGPVGTNQSESPSYYNKGGQVKDDIYSKYLKLSGGLPSVPKLENPLAKVHAPSDKKYPLNIPRGAKMHFPKRLKSINSISGFAEGTSDVHSQKMDLGDIPITPSTPYPGEEEEAQKSVDASTQGQLESMIDEHNNSQNLLKRIDQALGKKTNDEDYPQIQKPQAKEETYEGTDIPRVPVEDSPSIDDILNENKKADTLDKENGDLEKRYSKEDEEAGKAADAATQEQLDKEKEDNKDNVKYKNKTDEDKEKDEAKDQQESKNNNGRMQQLIDAQNAQRNTTLINQLGAITDKMGGSMGHFQPQNQDIYKENIAQAGQPVNNLQQQIAMEKYDPNSATSIAFRKYLTKFGGEDIASLGKISAADAEQIAPMAFKQFEAKQAQEARSLDRQSQMLSKQQMLEMQLQQKREHDQERNDMLRQQAADRAEKAAQTKADKDTAAKTKAETTAATQVDQSLFGFRQPPDVKQARLDHYNAEKGLNTIRSFEKLPGGLDSMDAQMANNVRGEVIKIAQSGAPTEGGLNKFDPQTWSGKLATTWGSVFNKPTPAHAAAFLKEYKDYLGTMQSTAGPLIHSYNQSVLENHKRLMNPDDYEQRRSSEYVAPYEKYASSKGSSQKDLGKNPIQGFDPDAFLKGNK